MALIFANVTDVRIPQGNCIRIQETVGGRILWEKKTGGSNPGTDPEPDPGNNSEVRVMLVAWNPSGAQTPYAVPKQPVSVGVKTILYFMVGVPGTSGFQYSQLVRPASSNPSVIKVWFDDSWGEANGTPWMEAVGKGTAYISGVSINYPDAQSVGMSITVA